MGSWLGLLVAEQLPGDDRALDLGGALVDARRAHVAVEVLEQVPADQRAGAVDLHRRVHDPLGGLGGVQLGHGGEPGHAASDPACGSDRAKAATASPAATAGSQRAATVSWPAAAIGS